MSFFVRKRRFLFDMLLANIKAAAAGIPYQTYMNVVLDIAASA